MLMVVVMIIMSMLRLKEADAPSQGDAEKERKRELDAIVSVKGDFGQQVGQGNAEENARSERQRTADGGVLLTECTR